MKNWMIGILIGMGAGIIDITPMIIQKLPLQADLSAFSMWVVIGFILSITSFNINSIIKGLLISYLVLLPNLFIIGWENPTVLIPIFIMTTILGGISGFVIGRVIK